MRRNKNVHSRLKIQLSEEHRASCKSYQLNFNLRKYPNKPNKNKMI